MTQLLQVNVKLRFQMKNWKDHYINTIRPVTTILFKNSTNNLSISRLRNVRIVNKKVLKLLLPDDAKNLFDQNWRSPGIIKLTL